jgi:hypothetical protein
LALPTLSAAISVSWIGVIGIAELSTADGV